MISRIFLAGILGGVLAGLLWTALQQIQVTPMILEAETYEMGGAVSQDEAAAAVEEEEGWAPADGLERTLYTALANVLIAIAFGLFLAAGYAMRGQINWRQSILWGLGGFVGFNLAPALGLPPELPGAAAAPLAERQVWWLLTVVATLGGLVLLAFAPRHYAKALGGLLIVIPHAVGAPQPDSHGGLAPAELEQAFIYASLATNAIFWVVLGVLTAVLFNRLRGGGAAS